MLDIQTLRNDLANVAACLATRVYTLDMAKFEQLEAERKTIQTRTQELQARRNAPTKLMKELDYGKDYRYAHDEAGGYAAGEDYFPDGMPQVSFYQPVDRGLEAKISEKMAHLRKQDAAAKSGK